MIYRIPEYYRSFRCIADKCRDSCCIGWEIDIDSDTAGYYAGVGGEFGERLRDSISGGSFVLTGSERCPFLNDRGLCDIFIELGEENLCQICTDHPRYYEWFSGVKEGGVGMCCEEAARLILLSDTALTETEIPDEDTDADYDEELYELLLSARSMIMEQLSCGDLRGSLCAALDFAEELQMRMDNGDYSLPQLKQTTDAAAPDISAVFGYFSTLEPIDENWIPFLRSCADMGDELPQLTETQELYLRRIAVYFIYRYFMKGTFDEEILSRVKLAAVSVWLIGWIWRCQAESEGTLSADQCAWTAKNYSKEIEYSTDNIEALCDAFYTEPYFSSAAIMGLIKQL